RRTLGDQVLIERVHARLDRNAELRGVRAVVLGRDQELWRAGRGFLYRPGNKVVPTGFDVSLTATHARVDDGDLGRAARDGAGFVRPFGNLGTEHVVVANFRLEGDQTARQCLSA